MLLELQIRGNFEVNFLDIFLISGIPIKMLVVVQHQYCLTEVLDHKREYLEKIRDSFCKMCIKTYVVTPHLNCPDAVHI